MFVGNESIDLELTLIESAQCFGWIRVGNRFGAVLAGRPVWLESCDNGIRAEGSTVEYIRDYLDLDRDYAAIAREYAHLPAAKRAMELYPGMHVLNQETWPTLVTFIISANNNVSRIRKLCDALSVCCGDVFEYPEATLYGLPSPEKLAAVGEEKLRAIGMGYRAPYLIKTAQMVCDGFPLEELHRMDYSAAHAKLTELAGVGDKVADCVLLFGCRHASAFPVDTWVAKLLKSWFGVEAKGRKKMLDVSREMFGEHAGLLQQFLFHAARSGDITLD